jgi:hypothetical protein
MGTCESEMAKDPALRRQLRAKEHYEAVQAKLEELAKASGTSKEDVMKRLAEERRIG